MVMVVGYCAAVGAVCVGSIHPCGDCAWGGFGVRFGCDVRLVCRTDQQDEEMISDEKIEALRRRHRTMDNATYEQIGRLADIRAMIEKWDGTSDVRKKIESSMGVRTIEEKLYIDGLIQGHGIGLRMGTR